MKLRELSDQELEISFQTWSQSERTLLHEVILHVQEVWRRRLHIKSGSSSLLEYLVKTMKYSAPAAQLRVDAANLMARHPGVAEKIQTGALNLSQIGEIQRALQHFEKVHQRKFPADSISDLIDHVVDQSVSTTRRRCLEVLELELEAEVEAQNEKALRAPQPKRQRANPPQHPARTQKVVKYKH